MIKRMFFFTFLACCAYAQTTIDPNTLVWTNCGACPEPPEVIASGATVSVGVAGRSESSSQNNSKHVVSAQLPPAASYTITFTYNLVTWDSYNQIGTPNPPFNGGTGLWDSFSVTLTTKPYWQLFLTDPLTTTQIPALGFLWGGSSYGDLAQEVNSGQKTIILPADPNGPNYLNVGLDTASFPQSNHAFPSWGTFTILEIKASCGGTVSLNVPLYKQCNPTWGTEPYDHMSSTICDVGCALSSLAMVLSYHGFQTDPQLLNKWLKSQFNDKNKNGQLDPGEETYGYINGGVNWMQVSNYTGGKLVYKGASGGFKELDAELCDKRPVILQEPGHFTVAVGKTASTYNINDPGYNRTTLDDPAYGGTFAGLRKFGPPGSGAYMLYVDPQVHVLVTDPLGRRVGYSGGTIVNEVFGASYFNESIADDNPINGDQPVSVYRVLFIPNPTEGVYRLDIIGVVAGPATVKVYRYSDRDTPQTVQFINTNLAPGNVATSISTYSTRPGDLNSDGFVNGDDLSIVQASLGSRSGGPGYNPVADVNSDGVVDVLDLLFIGKLLNAMRVPIDILPGSNVNPITVGSAGTTPVAVLSVPGFDAAVVVDRRFLTFGRTSNEASLAFCRGAEDVNGDGLLDLVCHFTTRMTGFQVGDTEGFLWGVTTGGRPFIGKDAVRVKAR